MKSRQSEECRLRYQSPQWFNHRRFLSKVDWLEVCKWSSATALGEVKLCNSCSICYCRSRILVSALYSDWFLLRIRRIMWPMQAFICDIEAQQHRFAWNRYQYSYRVPDTWLVPVPCMSMPRLSGSGLPPLPIIICDSLIIPGFQDVSSCHVHIFPAPNKKPWRLRRRPLIAKPRAVPFQPCRSTASFMPDRGRDDRCLVFLLDALTPLWLPLESRASKKESKECNPGILCDAAIPYMGKFSEMLIMYLSWENEGSFVRSTNYSNNNDVVVVSILQW